MQNVMMIDNIAYAVFEVPGPQFILKSDVVSAFENKEGKVITSAPVYESFKFKGKYYGYYNVTIKPKNDDESISSTSEVHTEGTNPNLADNSQG